VYDIAGRSGPDSFFGAAVPLAPKKALAALKDALAAAKRPKGASHGVQLQARA